MTNDYVTKADKLIDMFLSNNYGLLDMLGLGDLDPRDDETKERVFYAIGEYIGGDKEGFEYYCQEAEKEEDYSRKKLMFEIIGYTDQFDKIKEYVDNAEKYGIKEFCFEMATLLAGLARSPKYLAFIQEVISDKEKLESYLGRSAELYVTSIIKNIKDVDVIDSFIKENAKKKASYDGAWWDSSMENTFYSLKPIEYAKMIANTGDIDYIKKCLFDEEFCKSLRFGLRDKAELAFATKDLKLINEYMQEIQCLGLPPETWIHLVKLGGEKLVIMDVIRNPELYGLKKEAIPLIISRLALTADEIKDLDIFKSDEGQIALKLYSGDISVFESNYKVKNVEISLPEEMTIGIEIESTGLFSNLVYGTKVLNGWNAKEDNSIFNNEEKQIGVEIVSPVLSGNTQETTKSIVAVAEILKSVGQYANSTCGGHVHIGADYLKSEQAFMNLIELWMNNEKILYIIANKEGELPRDAVSSYAQPSSKEVNENLGGLVQVGSEEDLIQLKQTIVEKQENRCRGINFKNLGPGGKGTIEFRLANGTVDADTWIENINLFGGLVKVAQDMSVIQAKQPEELTPEEKEKLAMFDRLGTDFKLTEAERTEILINLVIEDEKLRTTYLRRYNTNRGLLDQNPELEEKLDQTICHSLVRYSDKKVIGSKVFTGENPVTGIQMREIEGMLDNREIDTNLVLPADSN